MYVAEFNIINVPVYKYFIHLNCHADLKSCKQLVYLQGEENLLGNAKHPRLPLNSSELLYLPGSGPLWSTIIIPWIHSASNNEWT